MIDKLLMAWLIEIWFKLDKIDSLNWFDDGLIDEINDRVIDRIDYGVSKYRMNVTDSVCEKKKIFYFSRKVENKKLLKKMYILCGERLSWKSCLWRKNNKYRK